jgi:hypothetical protein
MTSNELTTAGRFGSSQATEPAGRGQRFPQIVVSAFRGPIHHAPTRVPIDCTPEIIGPPRPRPRPADSHIPRRFRSFMP